MPNTKATPGPWIADVTIISHGGLKAAEQNIRIHAGETIIADYRIEIFTIGRIEENAANAYTMAAAWDLLEAARLLETAEHNRQFCDECEDEGEPEACSKCFPAFDDARVMRRLAIAKAENRDG